MTVTRTVGEVVLKLPEKVTGGRAETTLQRIFAEKGSRKGTRR